MNEPARLFRNYNVWPNFPSLSISGTECRLKCRHCERFYLGYMTGAASPEKLVRACAVKKAQGAKGFLISGGCDRDGRLLDLEDFLPAIRKIHDMGMIIKLHTGLVSAELADKIAAAGVDIASQEMVGDDSTVSEIFGIDSTADDFLQTFIHLKEAGIPHIAPHIVIGLHNGVIRGEERALRMLAGAGIPVSTLALIVIRPTKGTRMENITPPGRRDVKKIASKARDLFPDSKIILGALRPRGAGSAHRFEIEMGALEGGVDGMELPSSRLLAEVEGRGMTVRKIDAFGVLPVDYENRF